MFDLFQLWCGAIVRTFSQSPWPDAGYETQFSMVRGPFTASNSSTYFCSWARWSPTHFSAAGRSGLPCRSPKHRTLAKSITWRQAGITGVPIRFLLLATSWNYGCSDKILAMIVSLRHLLGWIFSIVSSRENLILGLRRLNHKVPTGLTLFIFPKSRQTSCNCSKSS